MIDTTIMHEPPGGDSASFLTPQRGHVLILPSLTLRQEDLNKLPGVEYLEERLLFYILALRSEELHLTYLISRALPRAIIDYYLSFLPDPESAKTRLHVLYLKSRLNSPLTTKVLRSRSIMTELQQIHLRHPDASWIIPFNVTQQEELLAARLSLPLYGPKATLAHYGTKSSARKLAVEAGVPVVRGVEDIRSASDIEHAVSILRNQTGTHKFILKLNDSHAGFGNVTLTAPRRGAVSLEGLSAQFTSTDESWATFLPKLRDRSAVLEEFVFASPLYSPSAAILISPSGATQVLGSHDQLLGGPTNQTFVGCSYPASGLYREKVDSYASALGKVLASRGVMGLVGADFLAADSAHSPTQVIFSEINLRLGGTTHPLGTLRNLQSDETDRHERLPRSNRRQTSACYVATDRLESPWLAGKTPTAVISALRKSGLSYEKRSRTGVVLHMIGAVTRYGRLGATCLGNSLEQSQDLLHELENLYRVPK